MVHQHIIWRIQNNAVQTGTLPSQNFNKKLISKIHGIANSIIRYVAYLQLNIVMWFIDVRSFAPAFFTITGLIAFNILAAKADKYPLSCTAIPCAAFSALP